MLPQELIRLKRDGVTLSYDEIHEFFQGYCDGKIRDYQVSSMLMAIFFKGMSDQETADLTDVMIKSGERLNWNNPEVVVDKHSTGGIGDKTSLLVLPLAACQGVKIPMMAGRGLGHTGGTLDKLESIPGVKVELGIDKAKDIIETCGGVFMGQTLSFVPLDKKLYALRDVTSTVESIPLIVASILSKKISEGIRYLVMDVKYGSGAFMKSRDEALVLAQKLVQVSKLNGVKTVCYLTSMEQCLGRYAGNSLEIKECMDILNGNFLGVEDTWELSLELASCMVCLVYPDRKQDEVKKSMLEDLKSGKVLEKFEKILTCQGACSFAIDDGANTDIYDLVDVFPDTDGYISSIDVKGLGLCVVGLGGGRRNLEDRIDHGVGILEVKKVGEFVDRKTPLLKIRYRKGQSDIQEISNSVRSCFTLSSSKVNPPVLIWKKVE